MRLGAVLYPPERQSVIVVAAQSPEFDTRGLEEATQINFDYRDKIPQDELMDRVLEIIKPAPFIVEDKRSQFSWGAEGGLVQELLIQYAAGFTSGLTVAGVLARLQKLSRRPEEVLTEDDESYISPATTADAAWHLFSGFLKSAFKDPALRLLKSPNMARSGVFVRPVTVIASKAESARRVGFRMRGEWKADLARRQWTIRTPQ